MQKRNKINISLIIAFSILLTVICAGIVYAAEINIKKVDGKYVAESALYSDYNLAKYATENASDFIDTPKRKLIGRKLTEINGVTYVTGQATLNSFRWISCVDPHTYGRGKAAGEKIAKQYRILNIIDIGVDSPTSVKIYKAKTKKQTDGKEVETSPGVIADTLELNNSDNKKLAYRMALYAKNSTAAGDEDRNRLTRAFGALTQKLKDEDIFFDSVELDAGEWSQDIATLDGIKYTTTTTKDIEQKNTNVKIEKVGDNLYIGPFKATWVGGTVLPQIIVKTDGEVRITNLVYEKKASARRENNRFEKLFNNGSTSTQIRNNWKIKAKYSGKKLYIKVPDVGSYKNISYTLKFTQKFDNTGIGLRCRIVVLGHPVSSQYTSQNFAVYAVDEKTPSPKTIEWGDSEDVKTTPTKLKITKIDENGEAISKVGFRLTWNNKYVTGEHGWTNSKMDSTNKYRIYETNEDGIIELSGLPEGYYQAEEVYNNNENFSFKAQDKEDLKTERVYLKKNDEENKVLELELTNYKYTNLRILKYVKGTKDSGTYKNSKTKEKYTPIDGVGFKIQYYNEDRVVSTGETKKVLVTDKDGKKVEQEVAVTKKEPGYQWIAATDTDGKAGYQYGSPSKLTFTENEDEAMIFYTGTEYSEATESGEIILRNMPLGTYKAKEVVVPDGYGLDPTWANGAKELKTSSVVNDSNWKNTFNTFECANVRILKISGYVFSPEKGGKNEKSVVSEDRLGKYNANTDLVVQNVTVNLVKDNKIVATTKTNENGKYEFSMDSIGSAEELKDYSVKFEYDGMDFFAMTPNYNDVTIPTEELTTGATSKATENSEKRKELNTEYSEIKGTQNAELEKGYAATRELSYKYTEKAGDGDGTTGTGISEVQNLSTKYDDNGKVRVVRENTVTANTIDATYNLGGEHSYDEYAEKTANGDIVKVVQLNLGIIVREQPNLKVENQIEGVNADINGFTNMYATTFDSKKSENQKINIGVTYVQKGQLSRFKIYPSDAKTVEENKSNKLELRITYKISISNISQTLYSKVNELAVFYDKNYELESVGTSLTEQNKANGNLNEQVSSDSSRRSVGLTETKDSGKLDYNEAYIDTSSIIITPLDEAKAKGTNNYESIYVTYRVKDEEIVNMLNGSGYVPQFKNIAEINSYSTYEDSEGKTLYAGVDLDSAPGNVQQELNTLGMNTLGNEGRAAITAKFDNDTGYAEEFTINFKEDRTLEGKVFLDNSTVDGTTRERTSDGLYQSEEKVLGGVSVTLQEVVLNEDGTIKVDENGNPEVIKEYKTDNAEKTSTDGTYTIKGFIPGNYVLKYEYNNETWYDSVENTINALDYKSAVITNSNKNSNGTDRDDYTSDLDNLKWYLADNVSETDKVVNIEGSYEEQVNQLRQEAAKKEKYTEAIDNLFTRSKLDYKDINAKTTDESAINATMDAYTPRFVMNVELNTLSKDNTYLPQGYNVFNMDFGITERPKQEITISKKVSNIKIVLANGQILLDGDPTENKKLAGLKYIAPSSANSKGVVNIELDSELIHGSTLEITYKVIVENTSEADYYTSGYYKYGTDKNNLVIITPEVYDYVDNSLTYDATKNTGWEIVDSGKFATEGENVLLVHKDAISNITNKNTILKNVSLNNIEPGQKVESTLVLSRMLTNTNDELTYENDVEMVRGTKNGGRRIVQQVGSYMIAGTSGIGASSETVTITPPTGDNHNYVVYITIALGALLILASGIVIIKKKVLK